jgi:hypothetical protein
LRCEPSQRVQRQRHTEMALQSLIDAAHAAATAARQDQPGDIRRPDAHERQG